MVILMWKLIVYLFSTTPYPVQTLYLAVTSSIMKSNLRLQIESFITFILRVRVSFEISLIERESIHDEFLEALSIISSHLFT
jgi:hypothetical protein